MKAEMIQWSDMELKTREGGRLMVEVGEFATPEDHDDPRYARILLRFGLLHCQEPSGLPPVLFLAGGPGESAIDLLRHEPLRDNFLKVAQHRDVLLLDQRGCGHSERHLPKVHLLSTPYDFVEPSEAYSMLAEQASRCRDQLGSAFRPSCYTPFQSARDIAALADALELPQLDIWAHSYGTHLAMAGLKLVPHRIGKVLLCGFEGPDQTYKLPSRIQTQLEKLAKRFHGAGEWDDMLGDMQEVHRRLDKHPMTIHVRTGETAKVGAFGMRWLVSSWIGLSARFFRLPALYKSVLAGETAELDRAFQGFLKMLDTRPPAYYLNDAASGATTARLSKILSESASCLLGGVVNFPFPQIREAWGQVDLSDSFRSPLQSNHAIRIVTGGLDGFTPTSNALESLEGLPNATHEELPDAAHDDLLRLVSPTP